jgi:hypothetical protein
MIEQVRMVETFTSGPSIGLPRVVFGFGTHDTATATDAHMVTTAEAQTNRFRIIMDHLLVGNNLEEVECRFPVDANGVFARVPIGDTPDDIAHCAAAQDVLPSLCPGSSKRSLCICQLDAGCPSGTKIDGTPLTTSKGQSVGIKDLDMDGAADNTEFIPGAVALSCGNPAITIDADLDMSYWTPSGDQQVPAQGGFDALGPAIVFVPKGALPTNVPCGFVFAPDVVDKAGVKVCAPPGGDINTGCTPGDVSAVSFTVEPLTIVHPSQIPIGTSLAGPELFQANVPLALDLPVDPTMANSAITITENGAPFTAFTVEIAALGPVSGVTINWNPPGLMPNTPYVITFTTSVTDAFGEPLPQAVTFAFTSGSGN